MGSLFAKPKMPEPPAVPTPDNEAVNEARDRTRLIALAAQGRKSMFGTRLGSLGLQNTAPVARKKAFGE